MSGKNMKYMAMFAAAVASLASALAAATALPLKPGEYVLAGQPCGDAPFAAMTSFDGHGFSGPHTGGCVSTVLSRTGSSYRVQTRCTTLGDGTPAPPSTLTETYRIDAPTSFVRRARGGDLAYRLCPSH